MAWLARWIVTWGCLWAAADAIWAERGTIALAGLAGGIAAVLLGLAMIAADRRRATARPRV